MNCLFLERNKDEKIIIPLSQKNRVSGFYSCRLNRLLKKNCQPSILALLKPLPFHGITINGSTANWSDFSVHSVLKYLFEMFPGSRCTDYSGVLLDRCHALNHLKML